MPDETSDRVWIVQCLCPLRHCIMAILSEPGMPIESARTRLRESVEYLVREGLANPWCELCGAQQGLWEYEGAPTIFRTMEEARPALMAMEAEQIETARAWKAARN